MGRFVQDEPVICGSQSAARDRKRRSAGRFPSDSGAGVTVCSASLMHATHLPRFTRANVQLQKRAFAFAKRVLDLCPRRYVDDPSRVIWRQLIRAAPAASGILEEADEASSTSEFIYKMKLSLREMRESKRWLLFIVQCRLQRHDQLGDLPDEARQLASIFAAIVQKHREASRGGERKPQSRMRPTVTLPNRPLNWQLATGN